MIAVVAAVIENEHGEILLAQRPPGKHLAGLWEFPGGKVEVGESDRAAIVRELQEELHLDVRIVQFLDSFSHDYGDHQIELRVFVVKALGEPQATRDVRRFIWVSRGAVPQGELAPADLEPLKAYLAFRPID